MFKLIKKDFISSRNSLLVNFILMLVISGVMIKLAPYDFFLFISIVYLILMVITPITVGEKTRTDGLIISLPVGRSKIVYSRYLFALIVTLATVLIIFSYGFILNMIFTSSYTALSGSISLSLVLSVIFLAIIANSFFIPFAYRFGQMGLMIGLAAVFLLSTILFIFTSAGLRIEFLKNTLGAFFIKLEQGGISNFMRAISDSMGIPLTALLITGITATAVFISIRISLFIYSRKEF